MAKQPQEHFGVRDLETALESAGWHLCPGVVLETLHQILPPDAIMVGDDRLGQNLLLQGVKELLSDMDLKDIGERSLPESQALKQMRRLRGPLVLQVAAITNVCESKAANASRSSKSRLLRLQLTDGHTSMSAIEYRPISSLSLDIPPGTKVRISDATLHSGVLLLDESAVAVLGGHVQALYEAWKMEQTYSGLARAAGKGSSCTGISGPPPFRGLSVSSLAESSHRPDKNLNLQGKGAETHPNSHLRHDQSETVTRSSLIHDANKSNRTKVRPGSEPYRPRMNRSEVKHPDIMAAKLHDKELRPEIQKVDCSSRIGDGVVESRENEMEAAASSEPILAADPQLSHNARSDACAVKNELSEIFPEKGADIVESVLIRSMDGPPVQNRMAAQKLLERKIHKDSSFGRRGEYQGQSGSKSRGRRGGKERMDNQPVYTLDEWEAKQRAASTSHDLPTYSREHATELDDEALARQLQQQLDFESLQATASKMLDESEQLRLSMFKFPSEQTESSSRGRGRGRRGGRRHRF